MPRLITAPAPSGATTASRRAAFIITGISRSGTSLITALMHEVANVVCFNEVLPMDVPELLVALERMRDCLLAHEPVLNKFDARGALTTDTLSGRVLLEERLVTKPLDERLVVASKRNLPYLNRLDELLETGFRLLAMIRDPVETIVSWSSPRARQRRIPGALIAPEDVHPHWSSVPFTRTDPVERRAEAWNHYAASLWNHRDRITLLRYEDLCHSPGTVIRRACRRLGLMPPTGLSVDVEPRRAVARSARERAAIRSAVRRLAPSRLRFGYE